MIFGDIYYVEVDYNYGRLKKILYGWRVKSNLLLFLWWNTYDRHDIMVFGMSTNKH